MSMLNSRVLGFLGRVCTDVAIVVDEGGGPVDVVRTPFFVLNGNSMRYTKERGTETKGHIHLR